jgi:hypothetical protein
MSEGPERVVRAKRIIQNKDGFEWFSLLGSMDYIDENLLAIAAWCRVEFEEEPIILGSSFDPYDELLHVRAVIYYDDIAIRIREADAMSFILRWC